MSFSAPLSPDAPSRTWSAILFDLDGTIIDSAPRIVEGFTHMFRELGMPVPSETELMSWIGPPIVDSLRVHAGLNTDEAARALKIYRDFYRKVAHTSAVFPGVAGLLQAIRNAGIGLALATSKPETTATEILTHAGLSEFFDVIAGASEDESRSAKSDIVEVALERLRDAGHSIEKPVMVGDRGYDALGAAVHGVPTIMVEWGYGNPSEAQEALAVVHSTDQLRELLLG